MTSDINKTRILHDKMSPCHITHEENISQENVVIIPLLSSSLP